MTSAGHHSMMGGSSLPYTEINGVRSDGTAYCALPGRINASSGAYEIDFTCTSSYSGDWHVLGAHGSTNNRGFFILNVQRSTAANGLYCFGYFQNQGAGFKFVSGNRYKILAARNQMGDGFELNGVSKSPSVLGNAVYNPGQFLIFRASATNSQTNPQASTSPTFIVIHGLKVWFGDTLVADLIPCRENATAEVCFYNKVDGVFVKNVTSGSLIEVT